MPTISPIEEILQISQRLESILKEEFGATGRGLHEEVTSVESTLSEQVDATVAKKCRFIATIRNKAVHEDPRVAADNIDKVRTAAQFVNKEFEEYRRRKNASRSSGCLSVFLTVFSAILVISVIFRIAFA